MADHLALNHAAWNVLADHFRERGRASWAQAEPGWGEFNLPESEWRLLPDDLSGMDTVELGCGTAYVSAWLARRGARPVGIDLSERQLESARTFQREFGLEFPLHLGNAEATPFPDASFDFAISEYGAAIWCDPYRWIPEAWRLLRPGGRLVFLTNGLLQVLTVPGPENVPCDDRLHRDYFGLHRLEWLEDEAPCVEFHLGIGDWIRLFRRTGFVVDDFAELRPPEGATTTNPYFDAAWARRWPCEQVWKLTKPA